MRRRLERAPKVAASSCGNRRRTVFVWLREAYRAGAGLIEKVDFRDDFGAGQLMAALNSVDFGDRQCVDGRNGFDSASLAPRTNVRDP